MTHVFLKLFLFTFLLIFILSVFCQDHSKSPVIARVGKTTLTVEALKKSIPPEYTQQITPEQNINYVKKWIETELFFQEALRKKIDKEKEIKTRLNKMKKDLLSAEFMNRVTSDNKNSIINNDAVHSYYEQNKESFKRQHTIIQYMELVVPDSRTAWYITKNGTQENILSLAAEYSQNPVHDNMNIPYVPLANVPSEFRSILQSQTIGSVSNPVKTDIGYHVFYLISRLIEGETCTEEEVREDIFNLLSNKAQKEIFDNVLIELRLKTNVEFNPDLIKNIFHRQNTSQP